MAYFCSRLSSRQSRTAGISKEIQNPHLLFLLLNKWNHPFPKQGMFRKDPQMSKVSGGQFKFYVFNFQKPCGRQGPSPFPFIAALSCKDNVRLLPLFSAQLRPPNRLRAGTDNEIFAKAFQLILISAIYQRI